MILNIITIDDDIDGILSREAEEVLVEEIPALGGLIDNMIETMLSKNGHGIAAPQVGVSKRIFVLKDGTVCINPKLIAASGKAMHYSEGCMSIKGVRYDVKRARKVKVSSLGRDGKLGILAPTSKLDNFAIQHELDHLNGILIKDKCRRRDV